MQLAIAGCMRWLLLLLLTGCDSEFEEPGEDFEEPPSCEAGADFFIERFIDEAPGVAIVELVHVESDTPVPLERGDVDTSPLHHCLPFPTCVEALLRDKPLSGPGHAVLVFDGARLRTSSTSDRPTGISIVDLKRRLVFEPARGADFDFTFDDRSVTSCVGASCQQLDFIDGTATLVTSFPRATSPEPGAGTASRSP